MDAALLSLPPSKRRLVLFKATPTALPSGSTFTRSTTATYKDVGGTRQTAAINTLRSGHFIGGVQTMLLEGASTNHFLNSGTPATQTSASLGTGTYTLWMEGTGSIAVAGTTATITGAGTASAGVNVTFTVTVAGTVTYTVTGSPTLAQAENQPVATSYIPTAGASVTRGADLLWFTFQFAPQPMTIYAKSTNLGTWQIGSGGSPSLYNISDPAARLAVYNGGALLGPRSLFHNGTTQLVSAGTLTNPSFNDTVETRHLLNPDGSTALTEALNAGSESTASTTAANALPAVFGEQRLYVNGDNVVFSPGFVGVQSLKIASGTQSLATMRSL